MSLSTKTFTDANDELVTTLADLDKRIFAEPYSWEKIQREASTKHQFSAIIAYVDNEPCGFKAGYELTAQMYYSWIGGVVADQRKKGIASRLMNEQHDMVKSLGYKSIQTRTENQFRNMLLLNIKCGFDVVGVCANDHSNRPTIILEKDLT